MAKGPRLTENKELRVVDPLLRESETFMDFLDSLIKIVKNEFGELGLRYPRYDFDANILISIRDMGNDFQTCEIWLFRGSNNGTKPHEHKPRNDSVKFYFVPNHEKKFEIVLSIWLEERKGCDAQAVDFGYELEPRIIRAYIKSLPDVRTTNIARYDTAFSVIMHHSPIKFETTTELHAYGAKYGFDYDGSSTLLKNARISVNQKGGRV